MAESDAIRQDHLFRTDYSRHATNTEGSVGDKDTTWVRNAFMLPDLAFNDVYYRQNRYASSADMKFTDTRPGGSLGINSRPQFTPYADPRRPGRLKRDKLHVESVVGGDKGFGLGRTWSERYDDPAQKIYMRFGVPNHNTMANFIRRAFTYEEIVIARRGRTPSWLYDVGAFAGNFALFRAFPVGAMMYMIWKGAEFVVRQPANQYYSFKSSMHYYWMMVQTIVNTLMVNSGIAPKMLRKESTQVVGKPYKINTEMIEYFAALFPDFFRRETIGGVEVSVYFDVLAIASRAQRMANKLFLAEYEFLNGQGDIVDPSTFKGYLKRRESFVENYVTSHGEATVAAKFNRYLQAGYWRAEFNNMFGSEATPETDPRLKTKPASVVDLNNENTIQDSGATNKITKDTADNIRAQDAADTDSTNPAQEGQGTDARKDGIAAALKSNMMKDFGSTTAEQSANSALSDANYMPESIYDISNSPDKGVLGGVTSGLGNFFEAMDAEFRDGSGFAVFCVDYTGSTSESFSNSYGESELSSTLNNLSSKAKEFRYGVQDGNILGGVVDSMLKGAADLVFGTLESLTFGASNMLLGLAGSGFVDIPKHWQNSSANLPTMNYSMTLISPYNNFFSRLINIYLPLAMIFAGAVPRSTGRSSYAGPFICQCFDRGRMQTQLGAIPNVSITRATSNLGYSLDGKALAIEVSWSVVELSSIFHMPMGNGSILSGASTMGIDEDSVAGNYMAVLAGQDMYSQIYAIPRAITRLAKITSAVGRVGSAYYWSSLMHEKLVNGGGIFLLTRPLARFFEAVNVGSNVVTSPNSAAS